MRKEIQAVEWLLLLSGIILLFNGYQHIILFVRLFQVYFFLLTFGLGIWIATRYLKRYKKKNILIFHLKEKDDIAWALIIKSIQLLIIVSLSIIYTGENALFLLVAVAYIYFAIQVGKFGQPKLVFHNPKIYRDAIFFEQLEAKSFDIYEDGVMIHSDPQQSILFSNLDETKFKREVEFEENQILDDIFLADGDNEVIRSFVNEIVQHADKMQVPISRKNSKMLVE